MARLRTPARHLHQGHQIVTDRNQQRITDVVPLAYPDRSDGDQKVGDVGDMAAGEGVTASFPAGENQRMVRRDNGNGGW